MPRYLVSARGGQHATVEGSNWLTALGLGLDQLGVVEGLDRLACEVLANGTVIARDARTGSGYVVQLARDEASSARPPEGQRFEPTAPEEEPTRMLDRERVFARGPAEEPTQIFAPPDDLEEETEIFELEADSETPFSSGELDTTELNDQAVQQLLRTIAAAPLPSEAWSLALDVAQELVQCEAASALRLEPGGALRFVAATGPESAKLAGVTLPPGKGLVAFSASRRMGLIVNDAAADRRFYREMDQATGFATQSVLCVPVVTSTRTWGCIELLNPPRDAPFVKEHLDLIDGVARALAERLRALG